MSSGIKTFPDNKYGVTKGYLLDKIEALMSMDMGTIQLFWRRWGIWFSDKPEQFWRQVHEMIVDFPEMPAEMIEASRKWLQEHGV